MDGFTFNVVMFVLFAVSSPVYVICLVTLWKYRKKPPFKSPFYRITFNLGILDLDHLSTDWFLRKLANIGWLGVQHAVMLLPSFFARLTNFLWWYTGGAQMLGVLSLAVNRMCVIGFRKSWSRRMVKITLIFTWLFPLITAGPHLTFDFGYHYDNIPGGVMEYWSDPVWKWQYFLGCGIWCTVVALVCAVCYSIAFSKLRSHRKNQTKIPKNHEKNQRKAEINLIWIGVMLCCLQGTYGSLCIAMSLYPENMKMIMAAENVVRDIYSWVNPYIMMLSSQKVRSHFKAVLLQRKLNQITPIVPKVQGK